MALTPLHVRDVCHSGTWGGPTSCKYLDQVSNSNGKFVSVCTKLCPTAYAALQKKRTGQHAWFGQSTPTGDNCQGYLLLHHKEQGYDK